MSQPQVPGAREEAERLARLRRLDCCAVSDALDRLGGGGVVVAGVPQASGAGRIAGRATTVKLGTGVPPPGPPRHLGAAAIEASGPDNVIVIEQRTGLDAGCWGGLLTVAAQARGVAGVLADGPVRDIDEARALGFAVFARAFTARTARGRIVELATNAPILFEGAKVEPGDYVIADSSGVAFIAPERIDAVLEAAEAIAAREAAMAKALSEGRAAGRVLGGDYEDMLKR